MVLARLSNNAWATEAPVIPEPMMRYSVDSGRCDDWIFDTSGCGTFIQKDLVVWSASGIPGSENARSRARCRASRFM